MTNTAPNRRRREASIPSWELCDNRELLKAQQNIQQEDYSSLDEMQALLDKFMQSPGSLRNHEESLLDAQLLQMSHAPDGHPEKQKVIDYTSDTKHGQPIANYLQNPEMVGKLR